MDTLPKTNTAPENGFFQKGISKLPGVYFQVRAVSFREV